MICLQVHVSYSGLPLELGALATALVQGLV